MSYPPGQTPITDDAVKPKGRVTPIWLRWFSDNTGGVSATIVTAKLTGGGAAGSMTFTNGRLTAHTPAT